MESECLPGEFVKANTEFAIDLLKVLEKSDGCENVFFSPFSISTALAMVYCGTKAGTAEELVTTLHFDKIKDRIGEFFYALSSTVQRSSMSSAMLSANQLFIQDTHPILPKFLNAMAKYFSAEPMSCNFAEKSEEVRQQVNNWVAEKTKNKIKNLLPPGSVNALTRLVLVNAVYFKGKWASKFKTSETFLQKFHITATESTDVQMMKQEDKFLYGENERMGCKFVVLPYESAASMLIILPMQDYTLDVVEKRLTAQRLEALLMEGSKTKVRIFLPRFRIKNHVDLVPVFKTIGLINLFDESKCDLSGVDGTTSLYVSKVFHQAFVDVNEEGAEAAAATGVVMKLRCMPLPPVEFNVNQPFLVLIRHTETNAILFMGKITKP